MQTDLIVFCLKYCLHNNMHYSLYAVWLFSILYISISTYVFHVILRNSELYFQNLIEISIFSKLNSAENYCIHLDSRIILHMNHGYYSVRSYVYSSSGFINGNFLWPQTWVVYLILYTCYSHGLLPYMYVYSNWCC